MPELDPRKKRLLLDPSVEVFLKATPKLLAMIAQNEHPAIQALNPKTKILFLDDVGFSIEKQMVINYLEGTMDEKNKFLFDNSDIRIFGAEEVIINEAKNKGTL